MRKYGFLLILIVLISACSKKNAAKPTLELLNTEVYFSGNSKYGYPSAEERDKSQTLLTYKITNPTDDNLLFIIDDEIVYPSIQVEKSFTGLAFLINNNNKPVSFENILVNFVLDDCPSFLYEIRKDSIRHEFLKKIKSDLESDGRRSLDNYINNYFVLHPNESRTFKTLLSLPVLKGIDVKQYSNLNENEKFRIYYSCDSTGIKRVLPDYLLQELKDNNTKIFNGVLMSKEIPLKEKK